MSFSQREKDIHYPLNTHDVRFQSDKPLGEQMPNQEVFLIHSIDQYLQRIPFSLSLLGHISLLKKNTKMSHSSPPP